MVDAEARSILDRVEAEERDIVLPRFDVTDAWALGSKMRADALEAGLSIAIGIVMGEQRVFHTALPGTSADNDGWLERKFRVVRRFGRSSFGVGLSFRARGSDFEQVTRLDPALYAAAGGAFPITIAGVGVVGAVGVSGLPQADDHAFVAGHLREYAASL